MPVIDLFRSNRYRLFLNTLVRGPHKFIEVKVVDMNVVEVCGRQGRAVPTISPAGIAGQPAARWAASAR